MDRAKIVDYYLQKLDKNFDLFDARKEMEKNNIPEEEIKTIIRLLDNELQRKVLTTSNNSKATSFIWIGAIVTSIGAWLTIATYFGIIKMEKSFLIAYGPILVGLSILFRGITMKK